MDVKKPFLLTTLAIIVAGSISLELSNTSISITDTGVPDNEATSNIGKAGNPSASAAIVITMYTSPSE